MIVIIQFSRSYDKVVNCMNNPQRDFDYGVIFFTNVEHYQ